MKPPVRLLLPLTTACLCAFPLWVAVPGFVWLEAEHFAEKGDWCVDTQFTHKMGSAYLICPGVDKPTALEKERARLGGQSLAIAEAGSFDVVVVGAGPGGMGAALGAARNGAKVALVFDRPVAGGNASTECGIGFDGASLGKQNARESGVVEEIRLTTAYRKSNHTAAFEEMAAKSPGLALFRNERVLRVEKDGSTLTAVVSRAG